MIKAKEFWTEVTTRKTSKSEAKKLYEESIQKETNALKDEKSNNVKKHKILNIHENLGSVFTADTYSHNKEVHKEIIFERSFAEQLKLKKERLNEVKRKE